MKLLTKQVAQNLNRAEVEVKRVEVTNAKNRRAILEIIFVTHPEYEKKAGNRE